MRKLVIIAALLCLTGCRTAAEPAKEADRESTGTVIQETDADRSGLEWEKENLLKEKQAAVLALFPGLKEDHHIVPGTSADGERILSMGGTGILCFGDAEDKETETVLAALEEENRNGTAVLYIDDSVPESLSSEAECGDFLPVILIVKDGNVIQTVCPLSDTDNSPEGLRETLGRALALPEE